MLIIHLNNNYVPGNEINNRDFVVTDCSTILIDTVTIIVCSINHIDLYPFHNNYISNWRVIIHNVQWVTVSSSCAIGDVSIYDASMIFITFLNRIVVLLIIFLQSISPLRKLLIREGSIAFICLSNSSSLLLHSGLTLWTQEGYTFMSFFSATSVISIIMMYCFDYWFIYI